MKQVYSFNEGKSNNKKLFGGKGAGLIEMTRVGLPVPPGFIITTDVCTRYYCNNKKLPSSLMNEVKKNILKTEKITGKTFGAAKNPLLVSVRSGAAISMPGMMDTILNLGLNDNSVLGLVEISGDSVFAWDSYRRFIHLFGKIVFSIEDKEFEHAFENIRSQSEDKQGFGPGEETLKKIVSEYKKICKEHTGTPFPTDPYQQLELAIEAVFKSWMSERVVVYREKYNITEDIASGTAVSIVAMVFGNMGNNSATGVVFTRNPSDGTKKIFGEYLINAQGEDVVAGTRTPQSIDIMKKDFPAIYKNLMKICSKLERHYKEPQDIEFTVERGKLYLLQTRSAKMNAASMLRTSVDMVREGLISKKRAILRLRPEDLDQILHRTIDTKATNMVKPIAVGIPASPGAATGIVVFDVQSAATMGGNGTSVILVREETKPEDVPAFFSSRGILTTRGGKTSHAAVVARGMGKPCIVGCTNIRINYSAKYFDTNDKKVKEGDQITIDGNTGNIFVGPIPTIEPKLTDDFKTILRWAEKFKSLQVRANADTPEAATLALTYGAKGIGLCRTERMFNVGNRLSIFVDMIMSKTPEERRRLLEELRMLQKQDFKKILKIMQGYKVTIRLLDPPLHEFLPNIGDLNDKIRELEKDGKSSQVSPYQKLLSRARKLAEVNPMMGHRGVRLGITHPEIYEMQIRAICEAAAEITREGVKISPQIMIPQVGSFEELNYIKSIYGSIKSDVEAKHGIKLRISFGTMIEVVRACLTADELSKVAEFFSFGTNDLTQAVFSFSREDAEAKFLPDYLKKGILNQNPFQILDANGVGALMRIAIFKGRKVKPNLEIGLCGEHGGDPRSIRFCNAIGLSYVSTSAPRIPIAILASAQASLEESSR